MEKWSSSTVFHPVGLNGAFIGVLMHAEVVSRSRPEHCPWLKRGAKGSAALAMPEKGAAATAKPRVWSNWRREIAPRSNWLKSRMISSDMRTILAWDARVCVPGFSLASAVSNARRSGQSDVRDVDSHLKACTASK